LIFIKLIFISSPPILIKVAYYAIPSMEILKSLVLVEIGILFTI